MEKSLSIKEYTLIAFLDIEGAFNNVLPTAITESLTDGTQAKRQRFLELPGPSAKRSKIQPSVSFAEITKNRVLLGLIDR